MKRLALAFIVGISSFAGDWSKADTARQLTYLTFLAIDYKQTCVIAEPGGYWEGNPILGRNPSRATINNNIIGCAIGVTAIAYMLPPKYRKVFQYAAIGVEFGAATYNYHMGVRFTF